MQLKGGTDLHWKAFGGFPLEALNQNVHSQTAAALISLEDPRLQHFSGEKDALLQKS